MNQVYFKKIFYIDSENIKIYLIEEQTPSFYLRNQETSTGERCSLRSMGRKQEECKTAIVILIMV